MDRARALRLEAAGPLGRRNAALIAFGAAVLAFLALPILIVIPISFSAAKYLTFPPPGWSTQWYARYFGSREWMTATWRSAEVALLTTAVATVLGTAAALALRRRFRGKSLVNLVILSPMVVPVIIVAIAIYGLYARLKLVGTIPGLVLAHTVLALPFVVVVVAASLRGFDETLERAAQNLGANRWQTFRLVTLPLIRPGVISAALLAFITSFDEIVIAIFISGARAPTLPKQMWDGIRTEIDPTVAAVSTLLIGVTTTVMIAITLVRRWSCEPQDVGPAAGGSVRGER
jgi:putative spermidine/putrescine transport system permease protein